MSPRRRPTDSKNPPGRAALGDHTGALVGQIEIRNVESQNLLGPGGRLVEQAPEGALTEGDIDAEDGIDLLPGQCSSPIRWGRDTLQAPARIALDPRTVMACDDNRQDVGGPDGPPRRSSRLASPSTHSAPSESVPIARAHHLADDSGIDTGQLLGGDSQEAPEIAGVGLDRGGWGVPATQG